jgi:hypothetical protein
MIWDAIGTAVKAVSDNIVAIIKEFHLAPDEALKLEMQMRQQIMEFQRNLFQLEMSDRDSARKRETALNDPTVRRLAYLYTCGYFSITGVAWYFGIPDGAHDTLVMLFGVLTAAQTAIIGYYFGSSHGSQQKDKTLDRVVNHKPSP